VSDSLHETHRWGERRGIPVCLDCRVEGYEDEPAAFAPCVAEKKCLVTKESWDNPGHTHQCLGGIHPQGMHFCGECLEWFGVS
jgi:hypothetical protein